MFKSGTTTLITFNEEMNDIMKIVTSWRTWFINKRETISKTIKNKAKEQKGGFRGMLLCTLGAS